MTGMDVKKGWDTGRRNQWLRALSRRQSPRGCSGFPGTTLIREMPRGGDPYLADGFQLAVRMRASVKGQDV